MSSARTLLLVTAVAAVVTTCPVLTATVTATSPTPSTVAAAGLEAAVTSVKVESERSIRIENDTFVLDGKPFRYVAGSLHYFRLPAEYWRDRLRKLRAAGLNAVSTYVEWSFHEPEERQYNWQGDRDLVRFVELAAEENLLVLLRPGPYICAERDLGGLPYWLLSKYPDIALRTHDKNYMSEVETWLSQLFAKVTPLLYGNGGPIILVQVENEYGSYPACDQTYMEGLRDIMQRHVGDAALLYTTDGTSLSMIRCGSVPNTLTTIDFGSGTNPDVAFRGLRLMMPHGPLVNSEYYPGWLTHWGESMQHVGSEVVVRTLRRMLDRGDNVNFYVFYGGTNFEFTAGANYGPVYQPDITSYDYDAPLTENGNPTPKYDAIKAVLELYHPWARELPRPSEVRTASYGPVKLSPSVALLSESGRRALGSGSTRVAGAVLPTFERLRQRAGLVLYETSVPPGDTLRLLRVDRPRDRIYVYVDGKLSGVLSRMHGLHSLPLVARPGATLGLLVESQGRINYGASMTDFKGILSEVRLGNETLAGDWTVLGYPLEHLEIPSNASCDVPSGGALVDGPVLFEGSFTLPDGEQPQDTFLDPTGWTKGMVWVNGHNLGRYWPGEGPQVTLYVPGVYLRAAPATNRLRLLELDAAAAPDPDYTVTFRDKPIFSN